MTPVLNDGVRWTPEEEAVFERGLAEGWTVADFKFVLSGRSVDAIASKIARAKRKGKKDESSSVPAPTREVDIAGKSGRVTVSGLVTDVTCLEDAIRVCKIDTGQWRVQRYRQKAYQGFYKDNEGKSHTVQMFSVTVDLEAVYVTDAVRSEIDAVIAELRAASKPVPALRIAHDNTGRMLELSLPDAHFGKLAWWRECGQSYDASIARAVYMAAVDDLLVKTQGFGPFDMVTLVVGNDMFNADNRENRTAGGTEQTTDGRQQKTFWIVRRMLTEIVNTRLKPLAKKVKIVVVSGNHDLETAFYLGEVLDAVFSADPDVEVDNAPTMRKYVEWGKCFLMFTHGCEEKHDDLRGLMAVEQPEAWGRTRFREIHLGHLHKKKVTKWVGTDEKLGVAVRILPSLCAAEDWHTARGYIGNTRSAEAYVWDASSGLVGTAVYNVPHYTDQTSFDEAMRPAA